MFSKRFKLRLEERELKPETMPATQDGMSDGAQGEGMAEVPLTAGTLDWHEDATHSREFVGKTVLIRGTANVVLGLVGFAGLIMKRDLVDRYRIPAVYQVQSVQVGQVIRVPLYDRDGADAPFEPVDAQPKVLFRQGQEHPAGPGEMLGAGLILNAAMHFDGIVPRIECRDDQCAELSGVSTPPSPTMPPWARSRGW